MTCLKPAIKAACLASTILLIPAAAIAQDRVSLVLNWMPEGDHAPVYFAEHAGWYEEAGLDVSIDPGQGSGMSSQNVGAGSYDIGIAELGTAFVAKGQGADLKAVMALYANSPFTLYWKRSSGIEGPGDFAGRTIGNPPADAARVLWPAFAQAVGLAEDAVEFVNVSAAAKLQTLMVGRVDIISDFYYGHDIKVRELGDDLGYLRWSEIGLNPYGNAFIVNGSYLEANPDAVARFVEVTQRAFAACVEEPKPCIDALQKAASGIDAEVAMNQWERTKELMSDEFTTTKGLGYFDAGRMEETYALVESYLGIEHAFDPQEAYSNEYLDPNVVMIALD
ncbi:MAG TPA: ABC transporter substrate-binding protein [Kiloniellales bacterium]|nr:ABC transporter substrate-binding protein [Kiloniellales bacterium]